MPHFGSNSKSGLATDGLVVMGPPWVTSSCWRWRAPPHRDATPWRASSHGGYASTARQPNLAKVERDLDGAALLLVGQHGEGLAPLLEPEGVREHARHVGPAVGRQAQLVG